MNWNKPVPKYCHMIKKSRTWMRPDCKLVQIVVALFARSTGLHLLPLFFSTVNLWGCDAVSVRWIALIQLYYLNYTANGDSDLVAIKVVCCQGTVLPFYVSTTITWAVRFSMNTLNRVSEC